MADRGSIATRLARILESGYELMRSLARLDSSKDANKARALESLQNLLGLLPAIQTIIQPRLGQAQIGLRTLQLLDDTLMQAEDIIHELQIQDKKAADNGVDHAIHRQEPRAGDSLTWRTMDAFSNLVIILNDLANLGEQQTEDDSRQFLAERPAFDNFMRQLTKTYPPPNDVLSDPSVFMQPEGVERSDGVIDGLTEGPDDSSFGNLLRDIQQNQRPGIPSRPPSGSAHDDPEPRHSPSSPMGSSEGILSKIPYFPRPSSAFGNFFGLLTDVGLMEKPVPLGYTRFRWKNRHGKCLYDDFMENIPGGLQELREYFDTYSTPIKANNQGDQMKISDSTPFNDRTRTSSSGYGHSAAHGINESNRTQNGVKGGLDTDIEGGCQEARPVFLLLCIERNGRPHQLHQESITDIIDDSQLFDTLRQIYKSQMGSFRKVWSLRALESIQFMKFIYEGHSQIDIRCHDELCKSNQCLCVPPVSLVTPKGSEYECRPIPPSLSPPVGSKHMMDLFNDPSAYSPGGTRVLQQFPKKIHVNLKNSNWEQVEAWGICFKEGLDRSKLWVLLGVIFGIGSLSFGILWGVLKKDVQGAFGVAGWWVTGATILINIIATY